MERRVEVEAVKEVYGGFFKMEQFSFTQSTPEGGVSPVVTREVFQRGHAAAVLIYDPKADKVLIVEEFRIGHLAAGFTGPDCWSAGPVAGMIDGAEDPRVCVVREAMEEAGVEITMDSLIGPIEAFSSPGGSSEMLSFFIATADLEGVELVSSAGLAGEGEYTEPKLLPREDAVQSIFDGPCNGHLALLLMWLERLIAQGQFEI